MVKQEKEYFLMMKNKAEVLCFYMDKYVCYPDESWVDATEGIVTDVEIISKGQDVRSNLCAKVVGKMVETEEINWQELECMDMFDVYTIGDWTFAAFMEGRSVKHYANIKGQGLQDVELSHYQFDLLDEAKQKVIYKKLVNEAAPKYALPDVQAALEVCIRNFAEMKLDCSSKVCVYKNAFFFVTYPGWYRDSCKVFVVLEDGSLRDTDMARFAAKVAEYNEITTFTLESLKLTMDKLGISAGADSGHVVQDVSKEERKLLTTYPLPGGGALVMFKASEFRFNSDVHKGLQDKVASGLGFWAQRFGEENEFISWMD